ncbi:MAG: hypothetical protein SGPRY_014073 [Prymnesium sp.]
MTLVAIRLAGRMGDRSAFQLVETLSFQVLMETTDVVELERALEAGPRITPWSAFQAAGPWGDSGLRHGEEPASGATVSIPAMVGLAAAWQLPQLAGADVAVEVPLALAATAAGIPDPERCARVVVSWVRAAEEPDRLACLCQEQWLARLAEVVAVARRHCAASCRRRGCRLGGRRRRPPRGRVGAVVRQRFGHEAPPNTIRWRRVVRRRLHRPGTSSSQCSGKLAAPG